MKNIIIGIFTLLTLSSTGVCNEKKRNIKTDIRIEIEYAGVNVIRLFNEGIICSGLNNQNSKIVTFFAFDTTNIKSRIKLYDFLNEELDINDIDSIYNNVNSKVFRSPIVITFIGDFGIKRTLWYASQPPQLVKLLELMNGLIPKEYINIFNITPPKES